MVCKKSSQSSDVMTNVDYLQISWFPITQKILIMSFLFFQSIKNNKLKVVKLLSFLLF